MGSASVIGAHLNAISSAMHRVRGTGRCKSLLKLDSVREGVADLERCHFGQLVGLDGWEALQLDSMKLGVSEESVVAEVHIYSSSGSRRCRRGFYSRETDSSMTTFLACTDISVPAFDPLSVCQHLNRHLYASCH